MFTDDDLSIWEQVFENLTGKPVSSIVPRAYHCHHCDTREEVGEKGEYRCWLCGSEDVEHLRSLPGLNCGGQGPASTPQEATA